MMYQVTTKRIKCPVFEQYDTYITEKCLMFMKHMHFQVTVFEKGHGPKTVFNRPFIYINEMCKSELIDFFKYKMFQNIFIDK